MTERFHPANLSDRAKGALLLAASGVLILALAAYLLYPRLAPASSNAAAGDDQPPATEAPARRAPSAQTPPTPPPPPENRAGLAPPPSTEMTLTVPALERVQGIRVKTAHGSQAGPLRLGAMHVLGTGYPWQESQNTYIAGHRLGFPGTPSDRLFWDLDTLETGDTVLLKDANGRRYEYRVFRRRTVDPNDISVAKPVPGKDVVSLQTCTLPDYERRLVVQAELVDGPKAKPKGDANNDPASSFGVAENS